MAKDKKSRIRYIIDSHSHADHISGARLLAEATEGELILPELAEINYEATRVKHGDLIRMGGVGLEIVHVPGHRQNRSTCLFTIIRAEMNHGSYLRLISSWLAT